MRSSRFIRLASAVIIVQLELKTGMKSFGFGLAHTRITTISYQGHDATTATEQGTASDRLQLALWSFLPSLRLPAVGELGRCAAARGLAGSDTFKNV